MPCTTILVGKKASYDGSTMIARNDDAGGNHFTAKKYVSSTQKSSQKVYKSVMLPYRDFAARASHALQRSSQCHPGQGIGRPAVSMKNVAMTATETITSNPRVLGRIPWWYISRQRMEKQKFPAVLGRGYCCLVLPYINSAREGVKRLGSLLEQYGTYEKNGIAFRM